VTPKAVSRFFSPDSDEHYGQIQNLDPLEKYVPGVIVMKDVDELLDIDTPQSPISGPAFAKDHSDVAPEPVSPPIIKLRAMYDDNRLHIQLDRNRGKMTIQAADELEMATLTAHDLGIQGSDDDFSAQIKTVKKFSDRAEYLISPWNLVCVMRKVQRNRRVIYVDLFISRGTSKFELLSMRLAE